MTHWGRKCDFDYFKRAAGLDVFFSWHIVEFCAFQGTVHASFHPWRSLCWSENVVACWWCLPVSALVLFLFWCFVSNWSKIWSGASHASSVLSKPFSNFFARTSMVLFGSLVIMIVCVVVCRTFWCLLPQSLARTSIKSGYHFSWFCNHLILFVRLSLSCHPLRCIVRAPIRWTLWLSYCW